MANYTQFDKIWFSGTPVNAVKASIDIGAGDNGTVTITYDNLGTEGNDYTIVGVAGSGNDVDLSATISGTDITLTFGTDGSGVADDTKNTATLIAAAIDALDGVSAEASGTGVTVIDTAFDATNFTGGLYGTPVHTIGYIVISGVWYIATKPAGKYSTDAWYSATPSQI